jgi:hypothetical protein
MPPQAPIVLQVQFFFFPRGTLLLWVGLLSYLIAI